MDLLSLTAAKVTAGVSCLGFVVGLYFPVMVLLDPGPSAMAYGVLLMSFPAWGGDPARRGLRARRRLTSAFRGRASPLRSTVYG